MVVMKKATHKTYIITAAVPGVPVNRNFIRALACYARDHRKAELLVSAIPMSGGEKDAVIDPYLFHRGFKEVKGDMRIGHYLDIRPLFVRAEMRNPLAGMAELISERRSAIIPATKQRFLTAGTTHEPRVGYTTGACTEAFYRANRVGLMAAQEHVLGAVVVETGSDGFFHARHIRWKANRRFTDLGLQIEVNDKDEVVATKVRAEAIIPGDWHNGDTDPLTRLSTFAMFKMYNPRRVMMHDIFNGHSVNHHEREQTITRARETEVGRNHLETELRECAAELARISAEAPKDCEVNVVRSNHDEWLWRYLQSGVYIQDPQNHKLALNLAFESFDNGDALAIGVRKFAKLPKVTFLKRGDSVCVKGWELGLHGDAGLNGSKPGTRQISNLGVHSVVGHRHTPEVYGGTIVVGTSTRFDLAYTRNAPSTWLHASAVVWPDGSAQLLVQLPQREGAWSYSGDYKLGKS
jgi:hypothetical protein